MRISKAKTNINSQKSQNEASTVRGVDVSIRSPIATRQVIYGTCRVGGVITFSYTNDDAIYVHVCLANHKINSVEKLWLNDTLVNFGGDPDPRWALSGTALDGTVNTAFFDKVFMAYMDGASDQLVQPDFKNQSDMFFPGVVVDEHRLRGIAYLAIILRYLNEAFPDGFPDFTALVEGKLVLDFRDSVVKFSNNAVLCILDYLLDPINGLGVPLSKIDVDSFSDGADIADEMVDKADGTQEKRYTIDFYFDSDETHQSILSQMSTAIAGSIIYTGSAWKVFPGKYITPTITLTEEDLLSEVTLKTNVSRVDSFNSCKGTFVDPTDDKYIEKEYPIVKNSFYISQDNGEEVFRELNFPCTTSASAVQRLARIELERIRQGIELVASFSTKAFPLEIRETVLINLPRFGFIDKPFEVQEYEFVIEQSGEIFIELKLRETAAAIYEWDVLHETTLDIARNSVLPSAFSAPAITGLLLESGTPQLYVRSDGTVFSRLKVSWDSISTFNGFIDIDSKLSSSAAFGSSFSTFQTSVPSSANHYYILDVQDGELYDVRVRFRNSIGASGAWAVVENHLVEGKSADPSDVSNFRASIDPYGVLFQWDAIPDLDIHHYEIRRGTEWASAFVIAQISSLQYFLNVNINQAQTYLIKAFDTSDNESVNAPSVVVSIQLPSAVQVSHSIEDDSVRIRWTESTGHFAILEYEIRYGDFFETASFIAKTKSTAIIQRVTWSGLRRFWVVAYDVAGNIGTETARDVQIFAPFQGQNLTAEVIDNNVLLRWSAPAGGTLPVDHYDVRKGATYATSEIIGNIYGTFSAILEFIAGEYTYYVQPVDSAGNLGQINQVSVIVDAPPDFELLDDIELDPALATTLNNIRLEKISAPPVLIPDPPILGDSRAGVGIGIFLPITYSN